MPVGAAVIVPRVWGRPRPSYSPGNRARIGWKCSAAPASAAPDELRLFREKFKMTPIVPGCLGSPTMVSRKDSSVEASEQITLKLQWRHDILAVNNGHVAVSVLSRSFDGTL